MCLRSPHIDKGFLGYLQLNLFDHGHGLSVEETKDLWFHADIDGNGVLNYKEFLVRQFTRN